MYEIIFILLISLFLYIAVEYDDYMKKNKTKKEQEEYKKKIRENAYKIYDIYDYKIFIHKEKEVSFFDREYKKNIKATLFKTYGDFGKKHFVTVEFNDEILFVVFWGWDMMDKISNCMSKMAGIINVDCIEIEIDNFLISDYPLEKLSNEIIKEYYNNYDKIKKNDKNIFFFFQYDTSLLKPYLRIYEIDDIYEYEKSDKFDFFINELLFIQSFL